MPLWVALQIMSFMEKLIIIMYFGYQSELHKWGDATALTSRILVNADANPAVQPCWQDY